VAQAYSSALSLPPDRVSVDSVSCNGENADRQLQKQALLGAAAWAAPAKAPLVADPAAAAPAALESARVGGEGAVEWHGFDEAFRLSSGGGGGPTGATGRRLLQQQLGELGEGGGLNLTAEFTVDVPDREFLMPATGPHPLARGGTSRLRPPRTGPPARVLLGHAPSHAFAPSTLSLPTPGRPNPLSPPAAATLEGLDQISRVICESSTRIIPGPLMALLTSPAVAVRRAARLSPAAPSQRAGGGGAAAAAAPPAAAARPSAAGWAGPVIAPAAEPVPLVPQASRERDDLTVPAPVILNPLPSNVSANAAGPGAAGEGVSRGRAHGRSVPPVGTQAWMDEVLSDAEWRAAARCPTPPAARAHLTDEYGRLWGWSEGGSCAYKTRDHTPFRTDGSIWVVPSARLSPAQGPPAAAAAAAAVAAAGPSAVKAADGSDSGGRPGGPPSAPSDVPATNDALQSLIDAVNAAAPTPGLAGASSAASGVPLTADAAAAPVDPASLLAAAAA
jgi:hypothetical protein